MTRHYETLFVVKPTLTEEEIKTQIDNVKSILEKNGAEISATFDWGMRKLAYEIDKNLRGYYYVIYYTAPSSLIKELERNFRLSDDVLKFMTILLSDDVTAQQLEKELQEAQTQSDPVEKTAEEPTEEKTVEQEALGEDEKVEEAKKETE